MNFILVSIKLELQWITKEGSTSLKYIISSPTQVKVVPYTSGKIWSARLIFLFFLAVCLNISTVINIKILTNSNQQTQSYKFTSYIAAFLSDTLSWFQDNQSLFLLLKTACLAEKQQIPILQSLVLIRTHSMVAR